MEWLYKLLGIKKKQVLIFVSYTWENKEKQGAGNSVISMNRTPRSWEDILAIKNNIVEWNLKDYPDASVMIVSYQEMK